MGFYFFILLASLAFFIFFRDDIFKILKPLQDYTFVLVFILLIVLGYWLIYYELKVSRFITVIQFDIHQLSQIVYRFFNKITGFEYLELITDLIFRALILGFFIFYPYFYEKKHTKIVYQTQIFSVHVIYAFLSLIFCMFCARFGI